MSAALKVPRSQRYGSAAELAAYAGLSVKTVRRLVGAGKVRGLKVGRRLLIPFADLDRLVQGAPVRPPERSSDMATIDRETAATSKPPIVPPISPDELARRNRAAMALLDSWETEGDEQEQRETMDVLREAFGERRELSSRPLFR